MKIRLTLQEWKNTLLRGRDAQALDKYWAAFQHSEARVGEQTEDLLKHMAADNGRQLVERFLSAHERMGKGYRKGHAAFVAANFDPVAGGAAVAGVDREATELLVQAGKHIEDLSKSVGQDAAAQGHRALFVSLGMMLAVFSAGVVGALMFSRSITRPLQRAVDTAQVVAAGDLAQTLDVKGSDETAELLRALDRTRDSLSHVVTGVRTNAEGVATMKGINDSSRRIADIIGTIDGIAFQTHILALNAAAALEIKTLIGDSVDRVGQGPELVDQAGTTLSDLVASIQRVSAVVADISAASSEQSTGVAQVGLAMSQIDEATQRNAALVEESMAAADSLRQQAASLVGAVAVFRTTG